MRRGSDDAFARIYDRHAGELLSYCRHLLGSRDDAEDALQQTFMNAYRAIGRSRGEISLRPWLFTIARNECMSVLRRRDAGAAERPEPTSEGLAAEVELREELKAMLTDLARLPNEQRDALLLSGVQRLSGDAIAEVLGTDRERVKALVYRARRSLAHGRDARETGCGEIRAQLSVLRGGSLRRKVLREHLIECEGCREFRLEVRRQRQLVSALLPVPLPLALKAACLPGAAAGVGHAATVGGVATGAGAGAGVVTKVAVGVSGLVAIAAAAGPVALPDAGDGGPARARPANEPGLPLVGRDNSVDPSRAGATGGGASGPANEVGRPSGAGGAGDGSGGSATAAAGGEGGLAETGPGPAPPSTAPDPSTAAATGSGVVSGPGPAGTPPGHGGIPPGQGGTPPGQGGTPPGQAGAPPGQAGVTPGHGGVPPGQGGVPPSHSDEGSTPAEAHSAKLPGVPRRGFDAVATRRGAGE